uniref:Male-enhanced antigen 1 n=1 Tax=Steinernema glaseri TaxID=37863 RepID=A0A1I7YUE6_9BILA
MVPTPPRAMDHGTPPERPRDIHSDDEENYEQDGWRIGFDVSYNGVGIAAEIDSGDEADGVPVEVEESSTAEIDSGDEADDVPVEVEDSSSEAETDPDSDMELASNREGAPDGYVSLRTIVEDPTPQAEEVKEDVPSAALHSFVPPAVQSDFQQALQEAEAVHANHPTGEELPSSPRPAIELDKSKISEIRKAMANVTIPEPQWAKDLDDTKFLQLLEKAKKNHKE